MAMAVTHPPISAGDVAPEFKLPGVNRDEPVSLSDYRGRTPVFLALLLGLWCPFCRRQIAKLAEMESKFKAVGVESLGVVATTPENARLYFRFRPTRLRLAADPELRTHRAYGVPIPGATPELMKEIETTRVDPYGDFAEPLPVMEAAAALAKLDGYEVNETDRADTDRQWPQLKSQYLIGRDGVVRWSNIECMTEGVAGISKLPSVEEILGAARASPGGL
jgi:peroxiredoxin